MSLKAAAGQPGCFHCVGVPIGDKRLLVQALRVGWPAIRDVRKGMVRVELPNGTWPTAYEHAVSQGFLCSSLPNSPQFTLLAALQRTFSLPPSTLGASRNHRGISCTCRHHVLAQPKVSTPALRQDTVLPVGGRALDRQKLGPWLQESARTAPHTPQE